MRRPRAGEEGVSLVALMAATAITLLMMSAAVPTWRYLMKNDREEELIFRGGQIADAVCRFQKKNANAMPPSLEALVKGRFLRKAYKDPMTADGKWEFVRNPRGATVPPPPNPFASPSPGASPSPTPSPTPSPDEVGGLAGLGSAPGPFVGVASKSKEKSLRTFNSKTRYSDWQFIAGQKKVVGKTPLVLGCIPTGAGKTLQK